jgi:hypothetical protein
MVGIFSPPSPSSAPFPLISWIKSLVATQVQYLSISTLTGGTFEKCQRKASLLIFYALVKRLLVFYAAAAAV